MHAGYKLKSSLWYKGQILDGKMEKSKNARWDKIHRQQLLLIKHVLPYFEIIYLAIFLFFHLDSTQN